MNDILRHLRRAALISSGDGPSDALLLEAFLERRDEAAFEALLRRHGPMVWGVCRRVVGNQHDAEDAFQATFVVFVRKAASLRARELLAGWLYGVAFRTASKARVMSNKRRAKEKQAARLPAQDAPERLSEELLARLDEELNRLPEAYRLAVVLCELQGKTRKEAAGLLGLPEGTLSWRLARARKLLAQRLSPLGTMLPAGAIVSAVAPDGTAGVPAALLRATVGLGIKVLSGQALAAETVSAGTHVLIDGVLKTMFLNKLKLVCGVALALIAGASVISLTYHRATAADPTQPGSQRAARPSEDDLDELRLEIAALRKGLQATRERVRDLEHQVQTLQAQLPLGGRAWSGGRRSGGGPGFGPGDRTGGQFGVGGGGLGMMGGGFGSGNGAVGMTGGQFGMGGGALGMMGGGGAGMAPGMSGPGGGGGFGRMPGMPGMGGAMKGGKTAPPDAPNPSSNKGPAGPAKRGSGAKKADKRGDAKTSEPVSKDILRELYRLQVRRAEVDALENHEAQLRRLGDDPLARAEAALGRLRKSPGDKKAMEQLQRALTDLEKERGGQWSKDRQTPAKK